MKNNLTLSTSLLSLATLLALALLLASCLPSDYVETNYATQKEAVDAGEWDRGWLPGFTPETATDIHLGYNLDSNDILLTFRTRGEDLTRPAGCTPTDSRASHALSAKWWSDAFYDDPATRYFQCDDEGWLAVDGDKAWYWRGLEEVTVGELARHSKRYLHLNDKLATVSGYVDFDNVFDTRRGDDRNSFALIPVFDRVGENAVFVQFDRREDARAVLDEILGMMPCCDSREDAVKAAVTGELHSFEKPMNFNTDIGYNVQVRDAQDVVFLTQAN
jgi:hypothetical protein